MKKILTFILSLIKPIIYVFKIPIEIIPLALIRPISGSASLAYLNNIFF